MMKNYFLYLTREYNLLRKSFEDNIVKDLESFKVTRGKVTSQYQSLCQTAIADVESSYQKLDNAKLNAQRIKASLVDANEKLVALEVTVAEIAKTTEDQKKDKEKEKEKNFMAKMFNSFQVTPEQEKESQSKKVSKLQHELLAATEELSMKRKELIRKIAIRDDAIDKVNYSVSIICK